MYEEDKFETFSENINQEPEEQEPVVQEPVEQKPVAQEPVAQEPTAEQEPTVVDGIVEEKPEQADTSAKPGNFSGAYTQQTIYTEPKPRKKMGWGKRIAMLCICGIILGGSASCAYYGVTQLIRKVHPQETVAAPTEDEVTVPEVSTINPVTVIPSVADGMDATKITAVYDVSDVVENVMPAMVSVINTYTETVSSFWGQSYTQQGASSGSGIIIGQNDTELLIATNYHVVSGNDEIEITFTDGATANAYIKGTDPQMDLAVVSVLLEDLTNETKGAIAVAALGNSEELKLGQPVIAIGNALGYGQSVTTGVVSATDREITSEDGTTGSFIQTDAAINPGNSGGALLNMNGQVIGINSSKIGGSTVEGMGFAIPISAAEPIISDLSLQSTKIKVDEAERGYLGVSIREVNASTSQMYGMPQGVFIAELVKDGAAEKAGMKVRDIIVQFDSFQISSYSDLQEALQYYAAGTTATVTVMRVEGGEYVSVPIEITLGEKPAQ